MAGLSSQIRQLGITARPVEINGQPGAMFVDPGGRLTNVFVLDIADGRVQTVRSVINPAKLRHLGPLADMAGLRRQLHSQSPPPAAGPEGAEVRPPGRPDLVPVALGLIADIDGVVTVLDKISPLAPAGAGE
jgi:hypothetical protein